ncbi:MAG: DUF4178 domain-containing protein [Geminicoccaceae bacterium]|nr:DUF4178 domain-containing protein [Geminicoccaceae bacterium]
MLEDDALRLAGRSGTMATVPSLIEMHRSFSWRGRSFTPMGHARIDYEHGFWDEWWVVEHGDGVWISVDEGDLAFERPLPHDSIQLDDWSRMRLGNGIVVAGRTLVVSEIGTGIVRAVRGELPEVLMPGQRFDYAHLSGPLSQLVTIENENGDITGTDGLWVDPFEIEIA